MNKTSDYGFTIIVPVFNEVDNIQMLEETLSDFLQKSLLKSCVLFVDDGSTDGSLDGIRRVCSRNDHFFYISFSRNEGLSAALKAGFDHAESEFVGYIDADLQTVPEDFNLLLKEIPYCSMAIGIRADRKDSFFKNLQSRVANGFRRMMTQDGALDTGCPLKVIRTDVARSFPMFKGMHRFLPALVLLEEGASYRQVPVRHFPRRAGKSKFHLWNRFFGPLADCLAYRWMKSRIIRPKVTDSNL